MFKPLAHMYLVAAGDHHSRRGGLSFHQPAEEIIIQRLPVQPVDAVGLLFILT